MKKLIQIALIGVALSLLVFLYKVAEFNIEIFLHLSLCHILFVNNIIYLVISQCTLNCTYIFYRSVKTGKSLIT